MDVFEKVKGNKGPLGQYAKEADGYFVFPKLEGEFKPRMIFRGKEVLAWSLNNYLGLANHPEVRKVDAEAAAAWGLGYPMGARAMSGHTRQHEILEEQLAEFERKESCYLLNYGYQGMVSIIDSILDRKDVVVYDSEAHACIIDGLRMHIGKRFVFPHNDIENLEKQLVRAEKIAEAAGGGVLVITEGVFGMSGDLGKLKEIVELKKKYQFRFLVDDAHGFGTMGATGAGTGEHLGVQDQIDLYFGTFAKSMALIGGFVAGKKEVIDFLKYNMRSQIFAKSLPMPCVIGAMKRLELLRTKPELKKQLWDIVGALQSGLKAKGFNLGNTESPVTPVFLNGTTPEATNLVFDLRENYGVFCSIVVYPVVPKDVIMLRLIPTAVHTLADVEYTIHAFSEILVKLNAKAYNRDHLPTV
ncbi:MAG: pyridoxal phosphate-dependent aminotransferase family protein [Bacteroidales bacterium]